MLHNAKRLEGFALGATDGEIGRVRELYFDDESWTVRYLVANTDRWLTGRQVLISPIAVQAIDVTNKLVHVALTRERIASSPSIESDMPVSRQFEAEYYRYYGWPIYWYGPALWGPAPYPVFGHAGTAASPHPPRQEEQGDPHLRSTHGVKGYHIHARDGDIGHLSDIIFEEKNWKIRYIVVDTRNWWPGKHVLIPSQWIERVSWDESSVHTDLTREAIKGAPELTDAENIDREYEHRLYQHYRREPYWSEAPSVA